MDATHLITTTEAIDPVFMFIFGASLVLLLGIAATMVVFVIRYRRSRSPEPTSQVSGNLWLEVVWIVLPTLLVLAMFFYGWSGYLALRNVPKGAMEVTVTARMWSWSFTYPNGKTSNKLYVAVNKPVKVELVSRDVIHGFYLPAFRVKRDVVPGMKNHAWFVATKPGSYDLFCSQYCGTGHSAMITTVEALPEAEFAAWLAQKEGNPGRGLLEKHGCLGCHTLDGKPGVGPTFKGLWGRSETVVTNGRERHITVDEAYVRRSILEPNADVVKGFQPVMPSFIGVLKEEEIKAIIGYLRTGGAASAKRDGRKLAQEKGCLGCHSLDGSHGVGPTFKGLFGTTITVLRANKGVAVTADEGYLRECIRQPNTQLLEGFQPIMPTFTELSDDDVAALVEFIKEVK
ncbi:MAG: cytochrome c oxidase subunit II [Oryzomonas sp.]|uniref:cytochrome c oxidase subunit II n=1 Tax=Oryzomonas sp. TaxID=2855186 RepID=UPI00284C922B|nr:cytochrome c oxidase subunit II [Oryzomonas sp.]MDR3580810.1 cytochrome c oxidase subunit II [Oryzomonas sp.]